jgi:hypothetical protein
MTTSGVISDSSSGRVAWSAVILIAAVMIVGMFAALEISLLLAVPTLMVALLLGREALRSSPAVRAMPEFAVLPPSLRETVERAMEQLPEGDARRLLINALVQARLLLAPRAAVLDERQESATRDNIVSLVDACCTTALELAQLDAARVIANASADQTNRLGVARELLAGRLSQAATALSSLYVAGLGQGSPASDHVAELADEINADARARRAATSEIGALLGNGEQPPSTGQAKG